MYANKPVLGVTGGIASGKSQVARAFGRLGCCVIDADALVRDVYADPAVRRHVAEALGPGLMSDDGVNRRALAARIFDDAAARQKLEAIVHPRVEALRRAAMARVGDDASVVAYVLDTPLLMETGLNAQCDALVFVKTPLEVRQERAKRRGWGAEELPRREKVQMPLDKKQEKADYSVAGTLSAADLASACRDVLGEVLSRSLAT
ncbi:MAG: dephospho-CoA kinase [Phycisphaerae bacterium]